MQYGIRPLYSLAKGLSVLKLHQQVGTFGFIGSLSKVSFAVLESLKLYSLNIQQIWHSQYPAISSSTENLTELKVERFCNLKYLMTFSLLKGFVQLRTLQIRECKVMEVVMLMEVLAEKEIMFHKLERLELFDLPKLKRFCSYCNPQEVYKPDQGLNGSGSQATRSTLVETIDTKVVFSQVMYLKLSRLRTFQSLSPQKCVTEWPTLKCLQSQDQRFGSTRDLQKATYNFTTLIGHGAFGPVYKAQMSTGEVVAVKVLATDSKQGEKEFQTEVMLLGRLHHRNLVNLVGYCAEKGQHMLVYVYMSKGSLASHLYSKLAINSLDRDIC